jgi:hypothetical protein
VDERFPNDARMRYLFTAGLLVGLVTAFTTTKPAAKVEETALNFYDLRDNLLRFATGSDLIDNSVGGANVSSAEAGPA